MSKAKSVITELHKYADPKRAKNSQKFFKTAKGEYGEGDVFIGVRVPEQRKVAKKFNEIGLSEITKLLRSKVHEHRLTAIIILVYQFNQGGVQNQEKIYNLFLKNTKYINNWDIIDSSAGAIVGEYLFELNDTDKTLDVLTNLAKSNSIWERRIAIMSTFAFTMHGDYKPTFAISDILLHDEHDLIQKAVGWMLREVGKRISQELEEQFLSPRYQTMPRMMLRYAIERFDETKRQKYLKS